MPANDLPVDSEYGATAVGPHGVLILGTQSQAGVQTLGVSAAALGLVVLALLGLARPTDRLARSGV